MTTSTTTKLSTLSLHDALPISRKHLRLVTLEENLELAADIGIDATTSLDTAFADAMKQHGPDAKVIVLPFARYQLDRKSTRLNSSHVEISYAVFCLKKKKIIEN